MTLILKALFAGLVFVSTAAAASDSERMIPVPTVTIHMGDVIDETMLKERGYPAEARFRVGVVESSRQLVGRMARRTLQAGEPVPRSAIEERRVVIRGVPTSILFEEGALSITGIGIPQQNGVSGQMLQVKNLDSGRMITGRAQDDGTIKVGTK